MMSYESSKNKIFIEIKNRSFKIKYTKLNIQEEKYLI